MKRILLLIFSLLALLVLVQNTNVVTVRLLFWSKPMSQVVLVLLTLVVGFLAGYLTAKIASPRRRPGGKE
ncbi:MAG: lipopolysaccharide assembly protein LapA domain-containing protein [Candidatus Eisenbacteria bacterium]